MASAAAAFLNRLMLTAFILTANSNIFMLHAAEYDLEQLKKVLQHTAKHFNYTKVPIFLGAGVSAETRDKLHAHFNEASHLRAQYIFDGEADAGIWNLLRNQIQHDVLNILLCANVQDFIWQIMDRRLRKLRKTRLIVLLATDEQAGNAKALVQQTIEKLWRLQFMTAIVLCRNEIFNYTPYPHIIVYKIAKNMTADYFPPPEQRDLQGYNITMPIENDIPRIFFVSSDDADGQHRQQHQQQPKGFAYQIFWHFMKRLNATLHISNLNKKRSIHSSVNMSVLLNKIGNLELEITLHPYTTIHETLGIIGYPIFKVRNCLIVPVHNEIERFMYLVRPFAWSSWLLVIVAVIYVAFVLTWLSPAVRQVATFHLRYTRTLLESISQIFFLSSLYRVYAPSGIYFFAYTLLAVLGFFTTTWYCNLLSSFLTTFLVGEQINTFEQWVASQLPVMAKGREAGMLFYFVPEHLKPKAEHLMLSVNASVMVSHLLSFNTSYAYPETEERWTFLQLQQQYANKPIYRYSDICFGSPTVGFPMRLDSHLEHHMTQFILDVQMSGLDHYWLIADFKYALKAGYVRLIDNVLPFKALDLDSLRFAWYIIVVGWILALFAFIFEHLRARGTLKRE